MDFRRLNFLIRFESDTPGSGYLIWLHKNFNDLHDSINLALLLALPTLNILKFLSHFFIGCQELSETDEGSHDENAHLYCPITP